MKVRYQKLPKSTVIIGVILLLVISSIALVVLPDQNVQAYSKRKDLSKLVPYHAAVKEEYSGEASLQMLFDYWGPSIPQQDIRNVTKGPLENDVATPDEIIRAAHFSDQSWARGNLKGYNERKIGYGGFSFDWTDSSPRFENRWGDLYNAIYSGYPVMAYMYKDFPPELNSPKPPAAPDPNNPQPPGTPSPKITPEDLAALEKVWRVVVGYDSEFAGGQLKLHDPLPAGTGALGGSDVYITKEDFDNMWNVYEPESGTIHTHRVGVSAAPWSIEIADAPKKVEAGTDFEITANITYSAPPIFGGVDLQDPQAFLKIPDDFSMAEGTPNINLDMAAPGSYQVVTWNVRAPDRTYEGQDTMFYVNATGTVVISDPAHRDRIGNSADLEIGAFGFLNHPPKITSANIDPDYIPDDGSEQPVITCLPSDEDGNIYRITVDLSSVGGSSDQRMYDDGKNGGDEASGDSIYSYRITREIPVGEWTFMITARDSKGANAYANVSLKVDPLSEFTHPPDILSDGVSPSWIPNDGFTTSTIWAIVKDEENDLDRVIADLTPVGGDRKQELNDDGLDGDLFSSDGNYSFAFTVGPMIPLDKYQIEIRAIDETGHETIERVWLDVVLPPVPPTITDITVDPDTVVNDGKQKVQVIVTVSDENDDVEEAWVDLEPLRGSSKTRMSYEGDDTWTLEFTVSPSVTPGLKGRIEVTVSDRTGLTATDTFSLTVEKANSPPVIMDYQISQVNIRPGDKITLSLNVTDDDFDPIQVKADLSNLSISDVPLLDDGKVPDAEEGDLTFTGTFQVPETLEPGNYTITIKAKDTKGGTDTIEITITVLVESTAAAGKSMENAIYIGAPLLGLILLITLVAFMLIRRSRSSGPTVPKFRQARPMSRPGQIQGSGARMMR